MENSAVFQFVHDSLKVAGASYNVINNELIMAQCQVQIPKTFFRSARVENVNLQMVTAPELLEKYPGSELVTKGSYRLQWFVDGIRERGQIARGTLPYELNPAKIEREITALLNGPLNFYYIQPQLQYQTHLLVNFHVSLETDEKEEELHSFSINLVTGEIATGLLQVLHNKRISPNPPPSKNLTKRQIPYSEGYQALLSHLKWLLDNHDPAWIQRTVSRWEEEVRYLEQYYQGEENNGLDEGSFYRHSAEVYRKFQPVIRIRIVNVALLFLPIVVYSVEPHEQGRQLPPIVYDPVRRKVR